MFKGVWKLQVPKERLCDLIDMMDADEDGFVSFDEVRRLLKDYAIKLKRSMRYARRR